jgi:hypothetical protein
MIDIDDFVFDCKPTVTDIKLLADIVFGQDYLSENQIIESLTNPQSIITTVCHKDRFIGVSFQLKTTLASLDKRVIELLKNQFNWEINQHIVLHKQTFLAKVYQGLGVGKELVMRSENKVSKLQLPQVSIVWKYKGNKMLELLKEIGYLETGIIPNYWHQDSIEKKYSCSICGSPCNCNALILVKPL